MSTKTQSTKKTTTQKTTQKENKEIEQKESNPSKAEKCAFDGIGPLQEMLKMMTQNLTFNENDENDDNEDEVDEDEYEDSNSSLEDDASSTCTDSISTSSTNSCELYFVIGALSNAFQTKYRLKDEKSEFDKYIDDFNYTYPSLVSFVEEFVVTNECEQTTEVVEWVLGQIVCILTSLYTDHFEALESEINDDELNGIIADTEDNNEPSNPVNESSNTVPDNEDDNEDSDNEDSSEEEIEIIEPFSFLKHSFPAFVESYKDLCELRLKYELNELIH